MKARLLVLTLLLAFLHSESSADGKFFATEQATELKTPFQRGLVSFRNGEETLIVESAIDAPSGDYAWVIPVSARPTQVQAVGPGALESAVMLLSPRVQKAPNASPIGGLLLAAFVGGMAVRAFKRCASAGHFVLETGLAIVLVGFLCALFIPVYAGPSSLSAGDRIKSMGAIGSYDVDVVASGSANDVFESLRKLKARVGKAEEDALNAYVKEGWFFVVARLRKDKDGLAAPHPLRIDFPVRTAVYPMRLTGVNASELTLQLVAIGPATANAHPLELWRSTRTQSRTYRSDMGDWHRIGPLFRHVSHPDLVPLQWDGAVLTYLNGKLDREAMSRDIEIGWTSPKEYSKPLYTAAARVWSAVAWFLYGWAGFAFLATAFGLWRTRDLKWALPNAFGISSLLAIYFAVMPIRSMTVVDSEPRRQHMTRFSNDRILRAVDSFRWDRMGSFPHQLTMWIGESLFDVEEALRVRKDVPGGYTIRREGDKWVVTVYDETAAGWSKSFEGP